MDTMKDDNLTLLAHTTRSPRGRYSKENTWPLLARRLRAQMSRERWRWLRRAAASVAVVLVFVLGWAMYATLTRPTIEKADAPLEAPIPEERHLREAMTFSQVPLQQIVEELNQTFASDISIADEELKDLHITATFRADETLDGILDLLQRVANLKIERQESHIIIKKGGAADEG